MDVAKGKIKSNWTRQIESGMRFRLKFDFTSWLDGRQDDWDDIKNK
jgi:hypothetical protein